MFTNLRDAVALGEVDREGVDLYCLTETGDYEKVYQCKGFERKFESNHLKKCLGSINSFIKAGNYTNEYFFVFNNRISAEYYNILKKEVDKIKKSGLADKATLLTVNSFIEYYNQEFC